MTFPLPRFPCVFRRHGCSSMMSPCRTGTAYCLADWERHVLRDSTHGPLHVPPGAPRKSPWLQRNVCGRVQRQRGDVSG